MQRSETLPHIWCHGVGPTEEIFRLSVKHCLRASGPSSEEKLVDDFPIQERPFSLVSMRLDGLFAEFDDLTRLELPRISMEIFDHFLRDGSFARFTEQFLNATWNILRKSSWRMVSPCKIRCCVARATLTWVAGANGLFLTQSG